MIRQVSKVIRGYFPKLYEQAGLFPDPRKRRHYQVAELVVGALAMFLLKETSRHAFNLDWGDERFKSNYRKIFKLELPHMDTAEDFLRSLSCDELEKLKATLISGLIEQKVLHKFRLQGAHFMIAIDGTGTNSYAENDADQSMPHRTSKNGIVSYYRYVVEAKLVTTSGLAISIASEWVKNTPDQKFDKQDCEQRAFERLAQKIKKFFPKLPICILADGLYPNQTFMKICQDNGWAYVVVLKDKSLKNLQVDITDVEPKKRHSLENIISKAKGKKLLHHKYEWVTETLTHEGYTVYWSSCIETVTHYDKNGKVKAVDEPTRFVHLTSLEVGKDNVQVLSKAGRTRWKIENEGFNTQKNTEYNLEHKYSRSTFDCYKNYYQCLQIAHMINQLAEQSDHIAEMLKSNSKLTIKHIWKDLLAHLKKCCVEQKDFESTGCFQIRLAG